MSSRWSIVGLFSLGFAAAVSAAVLVASLQSRAAVSAARPSPAVEDSRAETPVQVVVAARDLDPMTVVAAGDVATTAVAPLTVAEGSATDPIQVVGKVLRVPVKAGQAFSRANFAAEGSGVHLASALMTGKRAVSIALSDDMGIEPLLYPGSTVDVLATMTADGQDGLGAQRVSMTILQRVVVLAVGHETVVAPSAKEEDGSVIGRGPRPKVTLLLTPEQAEILKLAMDEGSLSLTLRNPMDGDPVDPAGTSLTKVSPIFAALAERVHQSELQKERDALAERERDLEKTEYEVERMRYAIERDRKEMEIARAQLEAKQFQEEEKKEETLHPQWQTLILRGGVAETKVFDLPNGEKK